MKRDKPVTINCSTCLGCIGLENPNFTGTSFCKGYFNDAAPAPEQMTFIEAGTKLNKEGDRY